ncbi:putative WRKY transcription factor 70 [Morus notabilis]|uniref:Putative WRKY transcription factor 70 n=1 Tax=Morus notabilis TaxID=981085 RepID=W9RUP9_9ROSA|nr:probable WRKY transcription factor 70 [Morus notabilis]EXB74394.1 putative WRKY transcription factor 70 [Morus notabilis]
MASSPLPENVLSGRQKLIDELVQGREIANRLQTLLSQPVGDDGSLVNSAEDLVSRIMESFTNTLFMLNKNGTVEAVLSQIQAAAATSSRVDSPCLDGRKSEDSGESCRSVSTTLKDRRGCYKRRKAAHTWQRETSTSIDDGHAWRKYGQKMILKAKHPRHYYRCTNKYDQGCQATKQFQKIQDNPPIFRTTYCGHHTCRNLLRAPELVFDSTSPNQDSSLLLSFKDSNNLNNLTPQQAHHFFSSLTSVKHEEFKDIEPACNSSVTVAGQKNQSSSSDYIVSSDQYHDDDLTAFDQSPGHMTVMSSNLDSDIHGDVISGVISFDDDVLQHLNF